MMSRPWQVWSVYVAGVLLMIVAAGWITRNTLRLHRAEAEARRRNDQQVQINRALWRLDSFLTPLITQEAARPTILYRSVISTGSITRGNRTTNETSSGPIVSPLLSSPPSFVKLHFQVTSDGLWQSPQFPQRNDYDFAIRHGASANDVERFGTLLAELRSSVQFGELYAKLPDPRIDNQFDIATGYNLSTQPGAYANAAAVQANPAAAQPDANRNPEFPQQRSAAESQGNDLASRNKFFQELSNREQAQQRIASEPSATSDAASDNIGRAVWIGDRLLVARRICVNGRDIIQGCWLDWDSLEDRLHSELAEVAPTADLLPIRDPLAPLENRLVSLPVEMRLSETTSSMNRHGMNESTNGWDLTWQTWSPMHGALAVVWGSVVVVASVAALMLSKVVSLSERRAAFVSAVTHELRTPLTTFRMYAEMLAEGMVPADQSRVYLETMRTESDRLSHLIENVLHYARIERGRGVKRAVTLSVSQLVSHFERSLQTRAERSGMLFEINNGKEPAEISVTTDPAAVEQIVLNLVDNACKYSNGEDRRIRVELDRDSKCLHVRVRDFGAGLSADARRRLFQPFSKSDREAAVTAPGVGLGLALSYRLARELGGDLVLEQSGPTGTCFRLSLPT